MSNDLTKDNKQRVNLSQHKNINLKNKFCFKKFLLHNLGKKEPNVKQTSYFYQIPSELYQVDHINNDDRIFYSILHSYAAAYGVCWVSNKDLIKKFPFVTEPLIKRCLANLDKSRLIFRMQQSLEEGGSCRLVITKNSHKKFCDKLVENGHEELANIIYEHFNNEPTEKENEDSDSGKPNTYDDCEQKKDEKNDSCEQKTRKEGEGDYFRQGGNSRFLTSRYIYNNITYRLLDNVRNAHTRDDSLKKDLSRGLNAEQVKEALDLLKTISKKQLLKIKNVAAYLTKVIKAKYQKIINHFTPTFQSVAPINAALKSFGEYFECKSVRKKPSFLNITSLSKGLEITTQGADASLCYHFFEYDIDPNGFFTKLLPICKKYKLTEFLPPKWREL